GRAELGAAPRYRSERNLDVRRRETHGSHAKRLRQPANGGERRTRTRPQAIRTATGAGREIVCGNRELAGRAAPHRPAFATHAADSSRGSCRSGGSRPFHRELCALRDYVRLAARETVGG